MNKIRIGHIGTLHDHSAGILLCVRKYPEIFEVVGVVPESKERWDKIKKMPAYSGLKAMTQKELFEAGIDAALIEGHEFSLIADAKQCIDRGIHVHIDKPAGADPDAFDALLSAAKEKKLVVHMGYMYRYNPSVQEALRRKKEGVFGKIFEVDAIMNTHHNPEKRAWLSQFPGGIMFFLGCHMIDLVYLFQGKPKKVIPFLKSTGFDGVDATDHAVAILEYENGISIARATSTEVNGYGRRQLVICGEKATWEIEPLETPTRTFFTESKTADPYADSRTELHYSTKKRYDTMMLHFAKCVRGEIENEFDYDYESEIHRLILEACGQIRRTNESSFD